MSNLFNSQSLSSYCKDELKIAPTREFNEESCTDSQPKLILGQELAKAKDLQDLHRLITALVRSMHFSDYSFRQLDRVGNDLPLSTFPIEIYEEYKKNGYSEKDFLLEYVSQNDQPVFASKIYGLSYDASYSTDTFRVNQKVYELYQKFGFLDFYCIPMQSYFNGANMFLAVSQRGVKSIEFQVNIARHKPQLRLLCETIDVVGNSRFSDCWSAGCEAEEINISKRQLFVLSTMANNDMTMEQIAEKLCLSRITVNQHMAAARRALKVRTSQGAIKKAIMLGLIEYT